MAQATSGSVRAVNVILEYTDSLGNKEEIDINQQGLLNLTFNRFNSKTEAGVLTSIDLTMFDKTGLALLTMFQSNGGKLQIKYGFENDLSATYVLNIVKFKSTFNNLGSISSVGAIGRESLTKFGPEIYKVDSSINDILIRMGKRNDWDMGSQTNTRGTHYLYENIDVGDLKLPWPLHLLPDEPDAEFIYNKILPICKTTVTSSWSAETVFWDVTLFKPPGDERTKFYFNKYADRTTKRRVWNYKYGVSEQSNVISLTNTIDYTFLIKGLTIEVAAPASAYLALDDVSLAEYYNTKVLNKWEAITGYFEEANLPVPDKDQFALVIEFVDMEEASDKDLDVRIFNEIRQAIYAINSIELEVVGNHKIMPKDIIDLEVKNKDGIDNIIKGLWKVVLIKESIGLSGFITKLNLVRESYDIVIEE